METKHPKGVSKRKLAELYSAELVLHSRSTAMTSYIRDCNLQEYRELLSGILMDCVRVSNSAEMLLNEVDQLIALEEKPVMVDSTKEKDHGDIRFN